MDIKEESCLTDLCALNEGEVSVKVKRETITDDSDYDIKNTTGEVEEEALVSVKVKRETITDDNDYDINTTGEVEAEALVSDVCSQRKSSPNCCVSAFNKSSKDSEAETGVITIKEEPLWQERTSQETTYARDDIEDRTEEILPCIELPSLCKEDVSSYSSTLSSNEDLGTNIKQGSPDATEVSSRETSICSETPDAGNIDILTSCLELEYRDTNISKEICKSNSTCACQKRYKCDICEKYFMRLSYLKNHKRVHEGIRPYKCNVCEKTYTKMSYLKTHTLIHKGIKPHKCEVCEKSFTDLSTFRKHKLVHDGSKPHPCNVCNKSFTRLSHLRRHNMIHEGEKPHKCEICNRAFNQMSTLKRHKLSCEVKKLRKPNI